MTGQARLDGPRWLFAFWASWCSRSADTSSGIARTVTHVGFSLMAYRDLWSSYPECSEGPSGGSKLAKRLAVPVVAYAGSVVQRDVLVAVHLGAAEEVVGAASPRYSEGGDSMKTDA